MDRVVEVRLQNAPALNELPSISPELEALMNGPVEVQLRQSPLPHSIARHIAHMLEVLIAGPDSSHCLAGVSAAGAGA